MYCSAKTAASSSRLNDKYRCRSSAGFVSCEDRFVGYQVLGVQWIARTRFLCLYYSHKNAPKNSFLPALSVVSLFMWYIAIFLKPTLLGCTVQTHKKGVILCILGTYKNFNK